MTTNKNYQHTSELAKICVVTNSENLYMGCGVYRVAVKNGKIVAAIYGGYHNSCPFDIDITEWSNLLKSELNKYGTIVKVDGSGVPFLQEMNLMHSYLSQ